MNKINSLIISKQDIISALTFYNITDKLYITKCYDCLESIVTNPNWVARFNEVYKTLYLDGLDRAKIKELWASKTIEDLFWKSCHPFTTNLLLLSGYNKHIKNMNKYNLDNIQKKLHIKRVNEALTSDVFFRNFPGIRIIKMLWGAYFINIRIIEVGRLQYELCFHNPINSSIQETCVKIHIPEGDKLYIDDVKNSIINSRIYIYKYFAMKNLNYYCISWLLSPELNEIIDRNSNIYKFYKLFKITSSNNDATSDILEFVFKLQECDNYNMLPETTSLQKALKTMLITNKPLSIGVGLLK